MSTSSTIAIPGNRTGLQSEPFKAAGTGSIGNTLQTTTQTTTGAPVQTVVETATYNADD